MPTNSITEGTQRFLAPDKEAVMAERPATATEDLKTEVSQAMELKASGAAVAAREASSIQSRADLRQAALNEARPPFAGRPVITVDEGTAKAWADLDTTEMGRMRSPAKREAALDAVAANMRASATYSKAIQERAPVIADAAGKLNTTVEKEEAARDQAATNAQRTERNAAAVAALQLVIDAEALARVANRRREESQGVAQALGLAAPQRAGGSEIADEIEKRRLRIGAPDGPSPGEAARLDAEAVPHIDSHKERTRALEVMGQTAALNDTYWQGLAQTNPSVLRVALAANAKNEDRLHGVPRTRDDEAGLKRSVRALRAESTREVAPIDVAKHAPQRAGFSPEKSEPTVSATRVLKRPITEEEVTLSLRTRFVVSTEKDGLLDKGRTEFTYRGGARDGLVAFADAGKQLTTAGEDKEVVRSMIEVASLKGWKEVTVSGTDEFKRAAWMEARLNGLAVNGYEPKEADKKRLAELQQDKEPINTISNSTREQDVQKTQNRSDAEALRERLLRQVKDRPAMTPDEENKFSEAAGNKEMQDAVRASAAVRAENDVRAVRNMGTRELTELTNLYGGPASKETERKARTLLDAAAKQRAPRPAETTKSAQRQPSGVHIDGDAATSKEKSALAAMKEILQAKGYGQEFQTAALAEVESRMRSQRVHVGELVQHGADHYKHDKTKDMSYFVTLKTAAGTETIWGKKLDSALEKGKVNLGDQIVLANTGKKPVSVLDQAIGAWKDTELNSWSAQPIDRLSSKDLAETTERAGRVPTLQVYDKAAARPQQERQKEREAIERPQPARGQNQER